MISTIFFLTILIAASIFTPSNFGVSLTSHTSGSLYSIPITAAPLLPPNLQYPICGIQLVKSEIVGLNLTVLDFAFLSSMAYEDVYSGETPERVQNLLDAWFGSGIASIEHRPVEGSNWEHVGAGGLAFITISIPSLNVRSCFACWQQFDILFSLQR